MIFVAVAVACVVSLLIGRSLGHVSMLEAAMKHQRAVMAKMDREQLLWFEELTRSVLAEAKRGKR